MSLTEVLRSRFRPHARWAADVVVRRSSVPARITALQHDLHAHCLDLNRADQTSADARLRRLIQLVLPTARPSAVPLVRVGAERDGGYVMADDFDGVLLVSMGVGWDDSWEAAALEMGAARCVQFDHTIRRSPHDYPARLSAGWLSVRRMRDPK